MRLLCPRGSPGRDTRVGCLRIPGAAWELCWEPRRSPRFIDHQPWSCTCPAGVGSHRLSGQDFHFPEAEEFRCSDLLFHGLSSIKLAVGGLKKKKITGASDRPSRCLHQPQVWQASPTPTCLLPRLLLLASFLLFPK